MTQRETLAHRLDRTVLAHSALFSIARLALSRGREEPNQSDFLTAQVMAAFAVEAYLNFVGENLFPFWEDVERISVRNKLSMICRHADIRPDFGRRPFQSLVELWKFRDVLAHARTESLSVMQPGPPPESIKYPETAWEKRCTLAIAERTIEDAEAIVKEIHRRAGQTSGVLGQLAVQGGEILSRERPST